MAFSTMDSAMPRKNNGRPHNRRQRLHELKSQPCDPNELRRKLYIVQAEQNAERERRRKARRSAEARGDPIDEADYSSDEDDDHSSNSSKAGAFHVEVSLTQALVNSFAAVVDHGYNAMSEKTRNALTPTRSKSDKSSKLRTAKDKLSRKASKRQVPAPEAKHEYTGPYHYVPQVAAKQFAATTTAGSMKAKKDNEITTKTTTQQQQGHKTRASLELIAERRISIRAVEPEEINRPATAIVELSPERTLVDEPVDPAYAQEHHRVDWTQSDETLAKRKRSFWALREKLSSFRHHDGEKMSVVVNEQTERFGGEKLAVATMAPLSTTTTTSHSRLHSLFRSRR